MGDLDSTVIMARLFEKISEPVLEPLRNPLPLKELKEQLMDRMLGDEMDILAKSINSSPFPSQFSFGQPKKMADYHKYQTMKMQT